VARRCVRRLRPLAFPLRGLVEPEDVDAARTSSAGQWLPSRPRAGGEPQQQIADRLMFRRGLNNKVATRALGRSVLTDFSWPAS
jgi:hypothetical protein